MIVLNGASPHIKRVLAAWGRDRLLPVKEVVQLAVYVGFCVCACVGGWVGWMGGRGVL